MFGCPICLDTPNMFGCSSFIWMHPLYVWMPHMFGCLLYIYNTNKTCFCQTERVSICPHTFNMPPYVWIPPYVWTPPICLDAPHLFGCTPCMFGCPKCLDNPLYVWMFPMFGHPPVCLNAPCLDTPWYVWAPLCLDAPHMSGCPMYIHNTKTACFFTLRGVHMPIHLDAPICFDGPLCLNAPICVDTPCMFGCSLFGCYLYVWTSPVCLDNVWMPPIHSQHKESMLCHTKGVSICPHTFGCPHMCGCTLYVWMPLMFRHTHMFGCPHIFEHPAVWLDTSCAYTTHRKHAMSH